MARLSQRVICRSHYGAGAVAKEVKEGEEKDKGNNIRHNTVGKKHLVELADRIGFLEGRTLR